MTATLQGVHAETDASHLIAGARELAPSVREYSDEIERDRRLPEPVVDVLRQEGGSMTFEASGRVIMGMEAGFPFF
jgi:hypothetical protein